VGKGDELGRRPGSWTQRLPLFAPALLLLLCTALPVAAAEPAEAAMIFLVRHAEKTAATEDPALSEAGRQRAQALAALLRNAGIEFVWSTDFTRTRDTAAPLATAMALQTTLYDWDEMDALAAELKTPGRRSLVVGHSDTTPELVGLLGGDPGPPIDEPGEYDRLYVVSIEPDGTVTTDLRRYGNPHSP
jgi:broad specificity phosphatase PhoE